MKKQSKLIHFGDTRNDLIYWIKQFFIAKIADTTKEHTTDDFDMAYYVQRLNDPSVNSIGEVESIIKESISKGLKSLKVYLRPTVAFYRFIDANNGKFKTITDISYVTLEHFIRVENVNVSDPKKKELLTGVRSLFNFIDMTQTEHEFKISKDSRGKALKIHNRPEQRKKMPVYLTEDEMRRFHDAMLKIDYKNEFEKNRDILIGRIFLFAGIQTSELIDLRDEDFVEDETSKDYLWLRIRGKGAAKREIPMPKRRLIVYLNAYKKARGESLNGLFFHGATDKRKEISDSIVRGVIEKLFAAAGITDKTKNTPAVLRNSFGVFVYRKMTAEGKVNADRYVKDLMGHADIQTTRWLVKSENPRLILAANCFDAFIDSNK